jgi:hypothetical protein
VAETLPEGDDIAAVVEPGGADLSREDAYTLLSPGWRRRA